MSLSSHFLIAVKHIQHKIHPRHHCQVHSSGHQVHLRCPVTIATIISTTVAVVAVAADVGSVVAVVEVDSAGKPLGYGTAEVR